MSFFINIFKSIFGTTENENNFPPPPPREQQQPRDRVYPQGNFGEPPIPEVKPKFVLPAETLSIDDYYASCNLQLEEGHYINHNDQNVFLGQLNFDTTTASRRNTGYKATSILPEPYVDLLNKARCSGSKALNEELFRQPELNERFLSKLSRFPENVRKGAEKFEIFAYLHLVQEEIEADMPVVQNVTISINNESAHGLDRNTISNIKDGKKLKSIIFINVPYQRNLSIKDKFATMIPVHLVRTKEVEAASKNPKLYKVYIAKVISPSQNKGTTTLIATLEAKIKKEFEGINANEKFSIFIPPNADATNSILLSLKKVVENRDLIDKIFFYFRNNNNTAVINDYHREMNYEMSSMFGNNSAQILFNQKQKEAIFAMTRSVNTTFILYGPPGSGKTYTIVETIRRLHEPPPRSLFNFFSSLPPTKKILICTPSNLAADAIAEAILDQNFVSESDIFRLMSSSRDAFGRNHKLETITRTTNIYSNESDEAVRQIYDIPPKTEIMAFKIIVCTLGSTPKLSKYLSPGHFSHIFVDEAAQASEMEIWLALGHLATKETRLILAGDPKQLGPVTTVAVLNRERYGFKTSLLMRLTKTLEKDPRYLVQLTDNHRSHHEIVNISSTLFYHDTLVPTRPEGHDSLCRLKFLPRGDFPILFHSVPSGVEEASDSKSYKNLAEVDVVSRYIRECLPFVEEKDIGVIAPYKFQAEAIRLRLKSHPNITVETVERFQGSERRVIIISTVRTSGDLGFMAQDLRINTAITRAKHLLIIIGNAECLKKDDTWKKIVTFCVTHRSFVSDGSREQHRRQ